MADVRFEIDRVRSNSFYHYTKYCGNEIALNSKGNPDTGWGLYSHLYNDTDKAAWISAVSKYNTDHNIETPSVKIKNSVNELRNKFELNSKKYPEKQSYILPALQSAISFAMNNNECPDNYLEKLRLITGGVLPSKKAIAKYALESAQNNIKIDIRILKDSYTELGITAFVYPLCDAVNYFTDTFFSSIDVIYDEYSRLAADPIYMFRKWAADMSLSDLERQRYRDMLDASIKYYSAGTQEIIVKILAVDLVKKMTDLLKSVETLGKDIWKSLVDQFAALKEIVSNIEFEGKEKFLTGINTILYALGGLVGALLVASCAREKEVDSAIETLCKSDDVESENALIEKTNNDAEKYREKISGETVIYRYAVNGENGYSLYKNQNGADLSPIDFPMADDPSVNELIELCKVSMCETIDPTDTEGWFDKFDSPEYIVIEFDSNLNFTSAISINQNVDIQNIIGYVNNVPVKSKVKFIVEEIGKNYIVGKYIYSKETDILQELPDTDNEQDNISSNVKNIVTNSISSFKDNQYDQIIEKYQKFIYSKDFIREYISFCRFPEFAQYTREYAAGTAAAVSTDRMTEIYETEAQGILDGYYADVKNTCKKKNIKKYLKKGKVMTLKTELDKRSDKCIDKIMNLYNSNPGNMKYCSAGRISDYMLYSHYMEFLYGDKFEYAEDNPYVKKLSDALDNFIAVRTRIELNKDNIAGLVESFNELCKSTISVYWQYKDIDYYSKLCELFQYDTYTNSPAITEGNEFNSISLYKRVVQYLKSITKFTRSDEYTPNLNESTDYNKLFEEQDKLEDKKLSKEEIRFEKNLKKIAYRFASLRKIEMSLSNIDISEYANDTVISQFNELKLRLGEDIYEYTDTVQYKTTDKLYSVQSILGPYIQMLKQITANEVSVLRKIFKDAVDFYLENKASVDSCEDIFKLGEMIWPAGSIIYKNGIQTDYFLFTGTDTYPRTIDDILVAENEIEIEEPETELHSMTAAPNTKYGIDSIKYWLKYCAVASMVNATMPMYWATGINIAGAPVPLPIIYIPIVPVTIGQMTVVIGIGLCGVCPLPMILFANTGVDNGSTIIPVNLMIDQMKKLVDLVRSAQKPSIKQIVESAITSLDKDINDSITESENISYQIDEIKNVEDNYNIKTAIREMTGQDITSFALETDYDIQKSGDMLDMITELKEHYGRVKQEISQLYIV